MDAFTEDSATPRFFDFKKRPYDGVDPRLTYQFWPAFQSELKRKGPSAVLDLRFNPLSDEPSVSLRRIRYDEALAAKRLKKYKEEYDQFLVYGDPTQSGLITSRPGG